MSIRINGLSFAIGAFSMHRLDMHIHSGEYFVLTGRNGAGKSVLMKLVAGLYAARHGEICIHEKTVTGQPPWKRSVGYVPQDGLLFPHRTVRGNISFGLEVRGQDCSVIRRRVEEMAEKTRVADLLERRVGGLSGGERQRVSLARALAIEPSVLLLDEPVSAIDEHTRDDLCLMLRDLQRALKITTLHIAHNRHEIDMLADRVGYMTDGALTV